MFIELNILKVHKKFKLKNCMYYYDIYLLNQIKIKFYHKNTHLLKSLQVD